MHIQIQLQEKGAHKHLSPTTRTILQGKNKELQNPPHSIIHVTI
jgi:hypothetical protein